MTREEAAAALADDAILHRIDGQKMWTAGYVSGEWWLVDVDRVPDDDAYVTFPTYDMLLMAMERQGGLAGWTREK